MKQEEPCPICNGPMPKGNIVCSLKCAKKRENREMGYKE